MVASSFATSTKPPKPTIKSIVKSSEASPPWDGFDSILEIPDGDDAKQNAWLTLQLRVKLNFSDSEESVGPPVAERRQMVCARRQRLSVPRARLDA